MQDPDIEWLKLCLVEAEEREYKGEVPIAALITRGKRVLGRGVNTIADGRDFTGHAELLAIEAACRAGMRRQLRGATMYVNLEPCPMCRHAIADAGIEKVVYALPRANSGEKAGERTNHLTWRGGPWDRELTDRSRRLLRGFFSEQRGGNQPN